MKKVLLVIIFCLFVSSVANAECVWVLWKKWDYRFGKDSERVSWLPIAAFPQYKQCMEKQIDSIDLFERMRIFWTDVTKRSPNKNEKVEVHGGGGGPSQVIITSEDGISVFEYCCLPDTIDPRK